VSPLDNRSQFSSPLEAMIRTEMSDYMQEFARFFGLAFSAFLPLINPLGSALMFVGFVGPAPSDVYRSLARKIAISTTLFLVTIEVVGTALLNFFGISLPIVQVAGGLALAAMGWTLLNQPQAQAKEGVTDADEHTLRSLHQKAFYPFTFPMTAGPGSLVVMVTLSAQASVRGVVADFAAHAGIIAAVIVLSASVFFCYGYAPAITARIKPETAHGVMRIIAFVLLCIGVQIMWNGIRVLLKTVLHA